MKKKEIKLDKKKKPYVEPRVIATYEKEELEDKLKSQGSILSPVVPPNGID